MIPLQAEGAEVSPIGQKLHASFFPFALLCAFDSAEVDAGRGSIRNGLALAVCTAVISLLASSFEVQLLRPVIVLVILLLADEFVLK